MKIGIDSYCYHRFFGEVYPQQKAPRPMSLEDFLRRARELEVDGVSLGATVTHPGGLVDASLTADENDLISEGTHERTVIDFARFNQRLDQKRRAPDP